MANQLKQRHKAHDGPGRLLVERGVPQDGEDRGGKAEKSGSHRVRSVTMNLAESPLGWLRAHGHVSDRQFAAGERLRGDWTLAGHAPCVTMRWDPAPGVPRGSSDRLDPTLARISAQRRFDGAIAAAGAGLADILWRVACAGEGVSVAESALGWPKRAGKLVLCLALDRVADYYGEP